VTESQLPTEGLKQRRKKQLYFFSCLAKQVLGAIYVGVCAALKQEGSCVLPFFLFYFSQGRQHVFSHSGTISSDSPVGFMQFSNMHFIEMLCYYPPRTRTPLLM
jgi:hypothetical protein